MHVRRIHVTLNDVEEREVTRCFAGHGGYHSVFGLEETNFERGIGSEVAVKEVASSPGIKTPVVAVENKDNEESCATHLSYGQSGLPLAFAFCVNQV